MEPAEDERAAAILGVGHAGAVRFAGLLVDQGELRGLIGPREVPRVWRRHVVNSAAVGEYLPAEGSVADVGSGAGLPGVVIALMRPDLQVHLVEPMQRRVAWLEELRAALTLTNITIHQARAEDLHGELRADVVTARAVAPLEKLARLTLPLTRLGGALLAMKGQRAAQEASEAEAALLRLGATQITVHDVDLYEDGDVTRVVEVRK